MQKSQQLIARRECSRGVVRIRDKHDARIVANRFGHSVEIVTELVCRNHYSRRADGLHRQGIHGKPVLRIDRRISLRQKRPRDQLQHIVGSVPEHNLLSCYAILFYQRRFEFIAAAVGIKRNTRQHPLDCLNSCWTCTQRIFIGRQLDDIFLIKSELPRQLGRGLTRLVGGDGFDVAWGEIAGGDHKVISR